MNNPNDQTRSDGIHFDTADGMPPFESTVLPEDFPETLERLKEASGLSWRGMARALGVDHRQLLRWRKGAVPSGGAMHAIFRFAARVPGGLHILLGDGFQMTFFREES